METVWVVVANRGYAKVYETRGLNESLSEVSSFEQPEARVKDSEMETDRPGRTFDSNARSAGRHAMSGADHTDDLLAQFSRKVTKFLDKEQTRGKFKYLILVAEPKFLGALRGNLGKNCHHILLGSVEKDLIAHPAEQIRESILHLLQEAVRKEIYT